MSTLASADPVAITWSAPPTVAAWNCDGCESGGGMPTPTATQDGTNADLQVNYVSSATGDGPSSDSTITDTFTLAAPADVSLSITIGYESSGDSCGDRTCNDLTSWDYTGGFSGGVGISGPNGGVLGIPFGNSATVAGTCGEIAPGDCSAGVSFFQSGSDTMQLAAGTYTLTVDYSDSNTSIGDSFSGATLDAVLSDTVATPEPNRTFFVVMLLLMVVALKRNFKSILAEVSRLAK
jgi:hypothetical protein